MELSVIIPALHEEQTLIETVSNLINNLDRFKLKYEVVLVLSAFDSKTTKVARELSNHHQGIKSVYRHPTDSFGDAIRTGIQHASGDVIVFYMADGSDKPADLVCFAKIIGFKCDMAFGTRFSWFKRPAGYPFGKWVLNRLGNLALSHLTCIDCNDLTNGFKGYQREVLEAVQPLEADGFDITLEIALKAVMKGYLYKTVPVSWYPRKQGSSKFNVLRESWGFLKTFIRTWR